MNNEKMQTTAIIANDDKGSLLTAALAKNADSTARVTIRNLLCVAFKLHGILCDHIGDSVFAAVGIGRNLRAIEPLLPHGSYTAFVTEHYCTPLGVSFRTIQRYTELSTDFDTLVSRLRKDNIELSEIDEREFLRGRSFNECRFLIRKLLSNESTSNDPQAVILPQPDENDWAMPDNIVARILDVTPVVDLDPFSIPSLNPYSARSTICKPSDGLAKDVAWEGVLVLNPGLKGTQFDDLADRIVFEFRATKVKEAFVFVPASMNSKYAFLLRQFPRVFTNKFLHVTGPSIRKTIKSPMMLVFVAHRDRFSDFFRAFDDSALFDPFAPVCNMPPNGS